MEHEIDCHGFTCELRMAAHYCRFDCLYADDRITDATGPEAIKLYRMEDVKIDGKKPFWIPPLSFTGPFTADGWPCCWMPWTKRRIPPQKMIFSPF